MDTAGTKSFNKNNLNKHSILNYKVDQQMTSLKLYYTDSKRDTLQTNFKNSTSKQISPNNRVYSEARKFTFEMH